MSTSTSTSTSMSREVFGGTLASLLAPLELLLADETVSEVLVNGTAAVYVERGGRLERVEADFDDEEHLEAACRNLSQYVHKRFEGGGCRIDGRLPDGSRVHILHGPASGCGTLLSIRKFGARHQTLDELTRLGSLSPEAADYLRAAVALEKNVVVAGSTGTGKTTMLAALAGLLDERLRILVLEDSRELDLDHPHVVHLEVRPPDERGRGAMTMRDLLHSALRLRPDRLILGEIRGPEALELVGALTSGHGGSFTTVHASCPEAVVSRLETLALLGLPSMSSEALRRQVCSAIDVVVQLVRMHDGRRRTSCVSEICGVAADGAPVVRTVFDIAHEGPSSGELAPTGTPSAFRADLRRAGLQAPQGCRPLFGSAEAS